MKRKMPLISFAIVMVLALLAGCSQPALNEDTEADSPAPHLWKYLAQGVESLPSVCGSQTVVTLYAGQTIDTGTVTVANDESNLYVTYAAVNGWLISETHLHVATSLEDIPQQNGNPVPGQFDYKETYSEPVETVTYVIQLSDPDALRDWTEGLTLYIAAHAVVVQVDAGGNILQSETAWGEGPNFPGRNWATYLTYTVQGCGSEPLPLVWDFRTQTQGGWGAPAHGNNPGVYRDLHFADAFPSGLRIGVEGPASYSVAFTTAIAIETFLPAGGNPDVFDGDDVDPLDTSAGVLAGQVVALYLNAKFDENDPDFSPSEVLIKNLLVADATSPCYGWSVGEVLQEADRILAGLGSTADPALSPEQINDCVARINENFVDGIIDLGFLMLP